MAELADFSVQVYRPVIVTDDMDTRYQTLRQAATDLGIRGRALRSPSSYRWIILGAGEVDRAAQVSNRPLSQEGMENLAEACDRVLSAEAMDDPLALSRDPLVPAPFQGESARSGWSLYAGGDNSVLQAARTAVQEVVCRRFGVRADDARIWTAPERIGIHLADGRHRATVDSIAALVSQHNCPPPEIPLGFGVIERIRASDR